MNLTYVLCILIKKARLRLGNAKTSAGESGRLDSNQSRQRRGTPYKCPALGGPTTPMNESFKSIAAFIAFDLFFSFQRSCFTEMLFCIYHDEWSSITS